MCWDLTCDDAFYIAVTDDVPSLASFCGKYIISFSLVILHKNYSYLSWVLAYSVAETWQISSHLMSKRHKEFLNEELKMTIKFEKRTIWFPLIIKHKNWVNGYIQILPTWSIRTLFENHTAQCFQGIMVGSFKYIYYEFNSFYKEFWWEA